MREFEDLGERTLEGFVTWRDGAVAVMVLVRFLGLGMGSVFSLSVEMRTSLVAGG